MITAIIIFIILCAIIGSDSPASGNTTCSNTTYVKTKSPSKKEIKSMKKAMYKAEMDAFEDSYMFFEAFMDD